MIVSGYQWTNSKLCMNQFGDEEIKRIRFSSNLSDPESWEANRKPRHICPWKHLCQKIKVCCRLSLESISYVQVATGDDRGGSRDADTSCREGVTSNLGLH
ncbi:hypothetical protein CEXT_581841 [Caerostris extrusa]|uniref:Uncharacterized protein n=1 Tax=Caerostris extrusa TaxID=172846 RepID=A0AAV4R5I7_CAEEX|nr:hypothetical protein CEXT_581841 [Caerostris extrusa]